MMVTLSQQCVIASDADHVYFQDDSRIRLILRRERCLTEAVMERKQGCNWETVDEIAPVTFTGRDHGLWAARDWLKCQLDKWPRKQPDPPCHCQ